jgi:hypothetical protein
LIEPSPTGISATNATLSANFNIKTQQKACKSKWLQAFCFWVTPIYSSMDQPIPISLLEKRKRIMFNLS